MDSIVDRRMLLLYIFLFAMAVILILGTISNWDLFRTKKELHAIHYIVDGRKVNYNDLRMQGMNAASEDISTSLYIHALEPNSSQLFSVLDERPNAIIIGDYVHDELELFVAQAKQAHIPIMFTDYEPNYEATLSIGVDLREAGLLAAKQVAPLVQEKGNIAILGFYELGSSSDVIARVIAEEITSYSALALKANIRCSDNVESCKQQMKNELEHHDIKGIVALDYRSAEAIAALVKELDKEQHTSIVAFDRTNQLLEYVQENTIDALLVSNTFNLGYLSILYADKLIDGPIDTVHPMRISVITKENMFWLQNQKLLFPLNQ